MITTATPATRRARALARGRILLLLVLLGALFLPWTTVQTSAGVARARGFESLGAVTLPLMLALWGLAVTGLLSTGNRSSRAGAALTDVAVAAAGVYLLASSHPWVPDPAVAPARAPALIGLALLALLQAALLRSRSPLEREVARVRAVAAFAAGVVFLYGDAYLAAGVSLWLALSAATVAMYPPAEEIESLSLLASGVALLVPFALLRDGVGVYLGQYVWILASGLLAFLATLGLAARRRGSARPTD